MKNFQLLQIILLFVFTNQLNAQWTTAKLSEPRSFLASATNGEKVIFAGGFKSNILGGSNKIDIYNTTTNSWTTDSLSKAYLRVGSAVLGDKVYLTCYSQSESNLEIINLNTLEKNVIKIPNQEAFKAITINANKVFLAGGLYVDIYDIAINKWTEYELPEERYARTPASVGNKVLFAGGAIENNFIINKVEIFDIVSQKWSTAKLSQERNDIAAIIVGNKVYFGGGHRDDLTVTNRIDIYDAANDTWSIDSLPLARTGMAATLFKNKLMFAGGRGNFGSNFYNEVQIFDLDKKTWTTEMLSEARHSFTAVATNDKAFFAGGSKQGGTSDKIDIYTVPISQTLDPVSDNIGEVEVFPNPTTFSLNLKFKTETDLRNSSFKFYTADGKIVQSLTYTSHLNSLVFDVSSLERGLYVIKIQNASKSRFVKFLKS